MKPQGYITFVYTGGAFDTPTHYYTNAQVWKSVVESLTGSEILSKRRKGRGQKQVDCHKQTTSQPSVKLFQIY